MRCWWNENCRIESFSVWTFLTLSWCPSSFILILVFGSFRVFTLFAFSLLSFLFSLLLSPLVSFAFKSVIVSSNVSLLLLLSVLFAFPLLLFLRSLLLSLLVSFAFEFVIVSFIFSLLLSLSLLLFEKWLPPWGEILRSWVPFWSVAVLNEHVCGHRLGDQSHDGVLPEFLRRCFIGPWNFMCQLCILFEHLRYFVPRIWLWSCFFWTS